MNLVIDGQILQTTAWHRGMGKYTLQMLQGISELNPSGVTVSILFNDNLECDESRYETVKYLCPNLTQLFCSLPVANSKDLYAEQYVKELEEYIEAKFPEGDASYLITSLFSFDFYALFPSNCRKLLLFYDLTPLLFWRDLGGYFPPELYMKRFEQILEAELVFSISGTTKEDLVKTFGVNPEKVINIDGGFSKITAGSSKPTNFEVPSKYILFPTGDLPHKNNMLAAQGFSLYNEKFDASLKLLVTSTFHEKSQRKLIKQCPNIVFTGNVSDEELNWLYKNADAVLFASKYEGLGIPILDAAYNDKPVIASRIPVFEEVSSDAFYYFGVDDPKELSQVIDQAVTKNGFNKKQALYADIMAKYTWQHTSESLLDGVMHMRERDALTTVTHKPKIAIASLHPGIGGQISRIVEPLYANIRTNFSVDFFFDPNGNSFRDMERPTYLDQLNGCGVYDIGSLTFRSFNEYEAIIYILDESAIPSRVAQRAAVLPGYLVCNFKKLKKDKPFYELVVESQNSVTTISEVDTDTLQDIIKWVQGIFVDHQMSEKEKIIRKGGTNRGIIKKLLKVE